VSWQIQEAERRFSELVRRTLEEGPQVVPAEEYWRIAGYRGGEKMDFKEFLMSAPEGLEHIIPERSKELPRRCRAEHHQPWRFFV
jgi:antitoxin Phd